MLQLFIALVQNNEEIIRLTFDTLEMFTRHSEWKRVSERSDAFHHWKQQRNVNLPFVLIKRS